MVAALIVLSVVLLAYIVVAQIRSGRKTKLMRLQGQEIEKQLKELQKQNKLLEDLNNEKQQIIGVVSHDLKGPFNRIFALIQLMSLTAENFTEDQKDYLGKIHQIVADGLGMIRNLLDNRRLEDQGLEPVIENLNASIVISSIVKNYRILSEKKKIEITFETPPNAFLKADKIYLNRIMDNLLTNAIKFSPAGKKINVQIAIGKEGVDIEVKDEGPGIDPSDKAKLFQKYQRLTPRPTGGESSTGLGLYLILAMVTRMNGTVSCESTVGCGTTFTVTLPKVESV